MPSTTETPQKKADPITPVTQSVPVFPPMASTPTAQTQGLYSRRPSLIEGRTACSSSSSLYELNVSASNLAGVPADHMDTIQMSSSLIHTSSSDDDSDAELDMDRIRSRRSNDIFKNDWSEVMGTQSPTFNPNARQNGSHTRDDYFTQAHHIDASTPIFKRLVSKNALKPQLKAFRRISTDLQHEKVPLENEISHEKLVLLNLKEDETLLTSRNLIDASTKTSDVDQGSIISKFDIIKRANESWNQKKHSFMHRSSTASSSGEMSDTPSTERNEEDQGRLVRKRSSFENDLFDFGDNSKRRAVSTSPISTGLLRRGSIKLISKASKDLEKMTLKNE